MGKLHFGIYFQDSMAKKLDKGVGLPLLQLSSNTIRQGLFQEKMQRSQVQKIWLVRSMVPGMIRLSWK